MRKHLLAIGVALLAWTSTSNAQTKQFQLKGLVLGASPANACGSAPVTDDFGEIIRKYKSQAPHLVDMGTQECEPEIGSFGGQQAAGPAKLLFLDGKLMLVKIELANISLSNFVSILRGLTDEYGKPSRKIARPFVTDSWKATGATLTIERLGREWDDNNVTILLKNDAAFAIYESRSETNRKILGALDQSAVKRDMR